MTEPIQAALRLGIPKILIQSATLDGTLDELVGWAQAPCCEGPVGARQNPEEEIAPQCDVSSPTLPLYDRNGLYIREITAREASRLVDSGAGEKLIPGGWRDRTDIPWEGIRLTQTPDPIWSDTALTHRDVLCIIGANGHGPDYKAARVKFAMWRFEHDDRAVLVVPR